MLKKQHTSARTMTFGENRDIGKVVSVASDPGKLKRMNVNLDEDTHIRFKAACARKGTSISDVVKELVDKWLAENE